MEYYWTTLFNNSNASTSTTSAPGQNRNFTPTHAWDDSWDLPTTSAAAAAAAAHAADSSMPDFPYYTTTHSMPCTSSSLYRNPDPHLTCLKLGKRHYFEDLTPPQPPLFTTAKKGKSSPAPPPDSAAVPRCLVEGCEAVLLNAKDYHRRHKVCEMHAKAPKVVVLGIEQRFCQQCSRFHVLGEFDEAKRSCRRRLAGHNERRRKSSQEQNSLARKHYHGGQPQLVNKGECALSLLSPTNSTPDLPARCSAALRELIAENRASVLANSNRMPYNAPLLHRGHVTLNLMHGPASAFALHNEDGDGDASHLWNLPFAYSPS